MRSGVFIETVKKGVRGLQQLPDLPRDKAYLVVRIDRGLHERIADLDEGGHWENALSDHLERAIMDFFRSRPIQIRTPKPGVRSGSGLKLYDPRDPRRDPIN